jgi:hypothetical protein
MKHPLSLGSGGSVREWWPSPLLGLQSRFGNGVVVRGNLNDASGTDSSISSIPLVPRSIPLAALPPMTARPQWSHPIQDFLAFPFRPRSRLFVLVVRLVAASCTAPSFNSCLRSAAIELKSRGRSW